MRGKREQQEKGSRWKERFVRKEDNAYRNTKEGVVYGVSIKVVPISYKKKLVHLKESHCNLLSDMFITLPLSYLNDVI